MLRFGSSRFIRAALAILFSIITLPPVGHSQTSSATISGHVSDASGAAVPGAKVTVTRTSTGVRSDTVTNQVGDYVVPFLLVGTYSVRIEKPGFRTFVRDGLILRVEEALHIDASLEVGDFREQVTVTGAAPLLNTDNGSTGEVIEKDRMEDMPLNGRNFLQLTQLTADVNQGPRSGWSGDQFINPAMKGADLSAQGQRDTNTLFEIDGVNARSGYLGTITLIPSLDTIQEFQIQTASFNARDGVSPVSINVVTTTGTNAVHGDLYEFDREAMLNAQNAFATVATSHLPWHQHNFGGTVGGPLILPHYNGKDKTFFFFGFEGNWEEYKNPKNINVPDQALRQGDFSELTSATIYNPVTGAVISSPGHPGSLQSAGLTMQPYANWILNTQKYWGPINIGTYSATTGAGTWSTANPYRALDDQGMARIDHIISNNDRLYGRWGNTTPRWEQPVSGVGNPNFEGLYTQYGQNLLVGETHAFGPQMFNEFRFAYNRSTEGCGPLVGSGNYAPDLGWGGVTETIGLPIVVVSGFGTLSDAPPGGYKQQIFQFTDNLTLHHGRHSVAAGLDIFENMNTPHAPGGFTPPYPRASVSFNGEFSGLALADFMLGYASSGSETINPAGYISPPESYHYPDFNFYVQDDWKFGKRLTLNLGLRWEKSPPLINPALSTFDYLTGTFTQAGLNIPLYSSPNSDFAPRFGFAWQPFADGKTVLRGGYGIYYGRVVDYGPAYLGDNGIVSLAMTQCVGTAQPKVTCSTGTATPMSTFLSPSSPSLSNAGWAILPSFNPTPYTQITSFDIQHQLPAGFMVDLGFKHTLTTHEDGMEDGNTPLPGQGTIGSAAHPRIPWNSYNGSVLTLLSGFNANYNAGIVRVEKRMGHGLSLLASFAYSKCLDQLGTPITQSEEGNGMQYAADPYNLGLDRGLCGMDIRLRTVYSFMYQLPVGHGKPLLNYGGVLNKIVGGWMVTGIATFSDGEPESVQDNFDIANTGEALERPDQYCNPNLPLSQRTTGQWFNAACFGNLNDDVAGVPSSWHYGTSSRSSIIVPGTNDWDIAVLKDISVNERARLQFRVESFNTMNHVPLSEPNGTMQGSTLSCVGEPCQDGFPQISTAGNPRQIQLALKLLW